jgi:hypothetical protein
MRRIRFRIVKVDFEKLPSAFLVLIPDQRKQIKVAAELVPVDLVPKSKDQIILLVDSWAKLMLIVRRSTDPQLLFIAVTKRVDCEFTSVLLQLQRRLSRKRFRIRNKKAKKRVASA